MILETGSAAFKGRRFVLRDLRNTKQNTGAEKAAVLADRINYETKEAFHVGRESDGSADPLYPWGNNSNGSWIFRTRMERKPDGTMVDEGGTSSAKT